MEYRSVSILDVLEVDLCARAILERVGVAELVRSERVSRRWQRAVGNYLRTCGTLSFDASPSSQGYIFGTVLKTDSNTIRIQNEIDYLPLMCKTLDKWGPYIKKVITNIGSYTQLDSIVSRCPNIEQIEVSRAGIDEGRYVNLNSIKKNNNLKQIVLHDIYGSSEMKRSDIVFGDLFRAINCESITVRYNSDLTGKFLNSLTSNLKSLSLTRCSALQVCNLILCQNKLRNIRRLELEKGLDEKKQHFIHLLIFEMVQLQDLTLRSYTFSNEWIQAISALVNLKRLTLYEAYVTDGFLEGLARANSKLEYLEIMYCTEYISARGVTALCRRSPSARTTLHFPSFIGNYDVIHQDWLRNRISRAFMNSPLYKQLAALGCVQLTLEWFVAACRDPRGRELRLNPSAGSRAGDQNNLNMIIFD